jgi:hypothetical protein
MPVTVTKNVSIKDKEGNISILTETDQIAESTDIDATCDSSRCDTRHNGEVVKVAWNIEQVKEKAEALPDGFFRLIHLIIDPRNQVQKVFCSAGCARDFLLYEYFDPLSPREEAVLQANNAQAELEKHRPKTNIVPFPTKSPVQAPVAEILAPAVPVNSREDVDPSVATADPGFPYLNPDDPIPEFCPREGA